MVQQLRNREEWILAAIIAISSVVVGGAVAAAFGSSADSTNIVLAILGFGGTTLSGLFAALKADKAEGNIARQIDTLPSPSSATPQDVKPDEIETQS